MTEIVATLATIIQIRMTAMGIVMINQAGGMTGTAIKNMTEMTMIGIRAGIMNTGITNVLTKGIEVSLTVVIIINPTGIMTMNTITTGIGIPGGTGKDIKECIRSGSGMEDIIMMTAICFSGFMIRMAAHTFFIPSADSVSKG
ncbi:MAG: hypothetical protein C4518_16565 [Desulfobacteraceae bacterium]|nr:MAG: hypothetical protein C4518_16565 [Desulfobacteraceae bacterium]